MAATGRSLLTLLLAIGAALLALWSAGTTSSRLAGAPGPSHAEERRSALMTMLGRVSATGENVDALVSEARSVARLSPLDDAPFLVLGAVSEQNGEVEHSEAFYAAALRRNPRSRGAHFMLAGRALARGEVDLALRHLASLARQDVAAGPEFTKMLLAISDNPALQPDFRRFLAEEPVYREALFATMANDPSTAERLLTIAPATTAAPPWLPNLVASLIKAQKTDRAALAWVRFGGGSDPRAMALRDSNFAASTQPPFGWSFDTTAAGGAARGEAGLDVESYGRDQSRLASQWVLLAPGTYRLVTAISGDVGGRFTWHVSCLVPTPHDIAAKPIGTAVDFTVPDGCNAQALELWTRADQGGTVSGRLNKVRLERRP